MFFNTTLLLLFPTRVGVGRGSFFCLVSVATPQPRHTSAFFALEAGALASNALTEALYWLLTAFLAARGGAWRLEHGKISEFKFVLLSPHAHAMCVDPVEL